ncbi:MAG TPA: pyridoxal 5'-phosphate synthase glutaminase subunit PdxT [Thermoanaerobaculaceae bacterium]|nr:pyridoxal 5'-phosphate synthase glutaminase subunit PdxT [Thermoanaerobaculaceae bacterium]HRS17543.1 pyridoxal 5'-phosphate synthase glutaminase subunit PdxT [Thermoanaerobaculaceae bacterium]
MADRVRVGVLALQGDFAAHSRALRGRGLAPVEVRRAADLDGVRGLVLPGGESTTMLKLLEGTGLAERLRELVAAGTPVLATCAGVILMAREVRNPAQASLGLLEVVAARNAYGRQRESAVVTLRADATELGVAALEGVFIRAPRLLSLGPGVRPLAWRDGEPVLVEQGLVLAATFHPELSPGSPVVDRFAGRLQAGVLAA